MNEINVIVADPAGNITLFVKNNIAKCDRVSVANQLLGNPLWKAEQVGFIAEPQMGGTGRLEMMGGEFCGNAMRSFGYYLASEQHMTKGSMQVEISGSTKLHSVDFDIEKHRAMAEMPVPMGMNSVIIPGVGILPVVEMEGITHVIAEGESPSETFTTQVLRFFYQKQGDNRDQNHTPEALGIMYADGLHMNPVVYVAATDSLVYENSCGSGSIAYAYYRAEDMMTGTRHERIVQPGGVIETTIVKEAGRVKQCLMGGPVELSEPVTVRL